MIWDLKELQENANTVANNKQVKDILEDHYYDEVWFYFYDHEKQVKYVSDVNSLCSWKVYALLKAGHIYALTIGDKRHFVYCYKDVTSSNGSNASYSNTLMTLATNRSVDSPEEIFNAKNIVTSYAISSVTKIEDLGKSRLARDLVTLEHAYKSKQEGHFNPKYELLGRYKGHHYSYTYIEENAIKIVLFGTYYVRLSIENYLVALAETAALKQLDLAFKDYNINFKLEVNK